MTAGGGGAAWKDVRRRGGLGRRGCGGRAACSLSVPLRKLRDRPPQALTAGSAAVKCKLQMLVMHEFEWCDFEDVIRILILNLLVTSMCLSIVP